MASRRSSGLWEQQSQSQSQSEGRSEGRSARERVEEARGGDGGKQLVLFVTVVSARGLAAASSSSLASSLLAKAAHGTRDEGKGERSLPCYLTHSLAYLPTHLLMSRRYDQVHTLCEPVRSSFLRRLQATDLCDSREPASSLERKFYISV
jgi:hypothetical protein